MNASASQVSLVTTVKAISMSVPHTPVLMDIALTLSMGISAFVMLDMLVFIVKQTSISAHHWPVSTMLHALMELMDIIVHAHQVMKEFAVK